MRKLLFLLILIASQKIVLCQEPEAKQVLEHHIKSVTISNKDGDDKFKYEYDRLGRFQKKELCIKHSDQSDTSCVLVNYFYDKGKLAFMTSKYRYSTDTAFYEYDSLGRLIFEYQTGLNEELLEYCYAAKTYETDTISRNPYMIREYVKSDCSFSLSHTKISYKNRGNFYLFTYRMGNFNSTFEATDESSFELYNPCQEKSLSDSFYRIRKITTFRLSDSVTQIVKIFSDPKFYDKDGERIFGSNIDNIETTVNYYSKKKLKHRSIKSSNDEGKISTTEIDYRYNKKGLIIGQEGNSWYYLLPDTTKHAVNHSIFTYKYEYW